MGICHAFESRLILRKKDIDTFLGKEIVFSNFFENFFLIGRFPYLEHLNDEDLRKTEQSDHPNLKPLKA